jgi:hypothetical protein
MDFKVPFMFTTDALCQALVAVLSQVQEWIEKPITYAGRHPNKSEKSHSASKSEMLVLVWATEYFRCYL